VSGRTRRLHTVHDVQVDLDGNRAKVSFPRFSLNAPVAHKHHGNPSGKVTANRHPRRGNNAVYVVWLTQGPNADGTHRIDGWYLARYLKLVHSW
jgi:hypothetical protein